MAALRRRSTESGRMSLAADQSRTRAPRERQAVSLRRGKRSTGIWLELPIYCKMKNLPTNNPPHVARPGG